MPSEAFAEAIQPELFYAAFAVVLAIVGIVFAYDIGKSRGKRSVKKAREHNREVLFRDSKYVEVVNETEDGYGTAARDVDEGVELFCFNEKDEIYQHVWISPEELSDVADILSEKAVERSEIPA